MKVQKLINVYYLNELRGTKQSTRGKQAFSNRIA